MDYAPSGMGTQIGIQPVSGLAAAELALAGADVSTKIKHGVLHDLSPRVGELSHEDLLGARAGAIQTEMAQQSAKIMDESARVGFAAPPMLQASDLSAWRAERQAAAMAGDGAVGRHEPPQPLSRPIRYPHA